MKRLLEFRVFDLLKDKDNEEFLDKVKKENPDLYSKFLNILGNKGLEKAKEKYEEYDPEFIKAKKSRKRKERTKEHKEEIKKILLIKHKDKIKEIEKEISNNSIKNVEQYIKNDSIISNYLKSLKIKKKYKNNFLEFLRTPSKFIHKLIHLRLNIETLSYNRERNFFEYDLYGNRILNIDHFYTNNIKKYNLQIVWPYFGTQEDIMRGQDFVYDKQKNISRLSTYLYLTENELYERLDKYSYYLSDEYYEKWKMEQDAKKYNI